MIYLVEDDSQVREMVLYALSQSNLPARGFGEASAFWAAFEAERPQLILLDVMLPGEDGLSILRRLRNLASARRLPVILLTARGAEMDRVSGLNIGADDYITKPFSVLELIARVQALLRRSGEADGPDTLTSRHITLDASRHFVAVDGREVELTLKEFELLRCLMLSSGLVMTREKLLELVWDTSYAGSTRTVDVHIQTLRQKLGPAGDEIVTVRGVGYRHTERQP